MSNLKRTIEQLEAAYETQRARLAEEYPELAPESILDQNSRPILLDALAAIANLKAAAAHQVPPPAEALTVRPGQTLILRYDMASRLSAQMVHRVVEQVKEAVPDVGGVLVVQADGLAAYDPGMLEETR